MDLSGQTLPKHFVGNGVKNTKFNVITFLPVVLFEQFRFFFNLFYLSVALAQFIPALKVGPLFTYLAPLFFVLCVTMSKELYDDYKRSVRDKEANNQVYKRITIDGTKDIAACRIEVGHIIEIHANQRVPADMLFLRTTDKQGSTFIRTDQLDGETDWKLRRALHATQSLACNADLFALNCLCRAEAPRQDIYEFVGKFCVRCDNSAGLESMDSPPHSPSTSNSSRAHVEPLTLENTLWASTVVAAGTVLALAVYTGRETRAAMNASSAKTKVGLFDLELNFLSKVLFCLLVILAFVLVVFKGLEGIWWIYFLRFILLLSSIIPISLRVNLDMAKTLYSIRIMKDRKIRDTVVRTSTIPEELGRIDYLLSDKTGTLTQNDMVFKKLHVGRAMFTSEEKEYIVSMVESRYPRYIPQVSPLHRQRYSQQQQPHIIPSSFGSPTTKRNKSESSLRSSPKSAFDITSSPDHPPSTTTTSPPTVVPGGSRRREISDSVVDAMIAVSLCHNVTPVIDNGELVFQAASPDEVALVRFASEVGLCVSDRTEQSITLVLPTGQHTVFHILHCFPFNSETKRMGIIVTRNLLDGPFYFYLKGAESVIIPRLQPKGSSWLQEECDNFARQGLRTLVVCYKEMSTFELKEFNQRYASARSAMPDRARRCRAEVDRLEQDMKLLCLTGVEDKLQHDVPSTLEALRHGGVKVWMLTGDKVETATCIAISAGLKSRQQSIAVLIGSQIASPLLARDALERFSMGPRETVLVVDGPFLALCLGHCQQYFIQVASQAPAVVCCRCSPTQKAEVVQAIKKYTKCRTCAIGDGGNDVSMIQAADVGVGIVGKEGKQASLAADFSVLQFCYLRRLLMWHGRNSYQRSAQLAQFVIHRGLIIAIIQVIFSAIFFFIPVAIFQGWLQVGYATYYTTAPVFSMVLDVELPESIVFMYPELYRSLKTGRIMSSKTFFGWVWKSMYQGAVIMMGAIVLFENSFTSIISITFTSLILSELLNVASEIQTWHPLMIASQICTVIIYVFSMFILRSYFDITFIMTSTFWWKVSVITIVSWLPVHVFQVISKVVQPPQYTKLTAL
eukprot:GHVS01106318.1.p1 GENE.GHVS01106318.1~~GHVS01106318.1.p1  ORF type:complete len:1183 (+),score=157.01 GHVS01106318.1:323-3550(+)